MAFLIYVEDRFTVCFFYGRLIGIIERKSYSFPSKGYHAVLRSEIDR